MKSEIRFIDREHLSFYNQLLNQTGKKDPYHKAFFYVIGISSDTRNNIRKIFDFLTLKRTVSGLIASVTAGRPAAASALPAWPSISGTVGTLMDGLHRIIFLTVSLRHI